MRSQAHMPEGFVSNSILPKFAAAFILLVSNAVIAASAQTAAGNIDQPAVTTCNIVTGVATGIDAGTCANPPAVCDGVADDARAFRAFNTWAKATTANRNGQLIELQVNGTCTWKSGFVVTNAFLKGLKKIRVMGYGATFTANGNGYWLGGEGICHKGIDDPRGCSARLATVSAGATTVKLLNPSLCRRFTPGGWAVVTGFDIQGTYNSPYGFPPNPHFFDYVQIASTSDCASSGQIKLGSPLTNTYLSTWPIFTGGSSHEADQGGPATIYALDPSWDTEVDIRGVTIDQPKDQTVAMGRSVVFRDITMTGAHCLIPSQNGSMIVTNATGPSCDIEVDKIIGAVTYNNVSLRRLKFQSSSTNRLEVNNSNFSNGFAGTPKVAVIANSTIPTLQLGPTAYGVPTSASCTNCVISNTIQAGGLVEKGPSDVGANLYYTVNKGVLSYPNTVPVTGIADNGSGAVRLTVPSTSGWATGALTSMSGIFARGPNNNLPKKITVVDETHIDLQETIFAGSVWSGGGSLNNSAPRWAVPGTNFFPTGQWGPSTPALRVTGVTQDSAGTHIATTLSGRYPNIPLSNGKSSLMVQMPYWTCTHCTGSAQAVDFSGAPPNIPFASYSNRTWTGSTQLVSFPLWGMVKSIKINVTQSYKGSINPLLFNLPDATVTRSGKTAFWDAFVDLRTAGLRTITPTGVTCDTGNGPVPGGCGADRGLVLSDPATMFAHSINPKMTSSPTDQPWKLTAEFIMDQGVVAP